jgi:hypothetical protein
MAPGRKVSLNGRALIALTAGFGGISPNVLQLAIDLVGRNKVDYLVPTFALGLVILAAMGAGIALVWGETDHKRAYYLGLGLPSLIQVAVASATHTPPADPAAPPKTAEVRVVPERVSTFSLFASPAYAEPLQDEVRQVPQVPLPKVPPAPQAGRKLMLVLEDVPKGAELVFTAPDGKVVSQIPLAKSSTLDAGSRVDLKVPDLAASAFLRIDNSKSELLPLRYQQGSISAYKIDVDRRGLGGFLKAFGVQDPSLLKFDVEEISKPAKP